MQEHVDYFESGSGKTIILLPSLWLTSNSFYSLARKLAKRYQVIVPDLFRGKSKYENNAITINDYVKGLNSFITEKEIKDFYLIGVSFSGFIAANYVQKYPSNIERLFLVSTSPIPLYLKWKWWGFIWGYVKLFFHNIYSLKGIAINLLWFRDGLEYLFKHPKQFICDALIITRDYDHQILLMNIPTKLLFAKKDEFIPFKFMDKIRKINNLEVEVIDGYHGWFFQNEELLVKKIFDFFK
ncbi:hypothetical protein A2Y99_04350 [Candidatus Gottesmanbacteria bacterium RBG_13_37_7]|uniref:AB hydrolase-1 domain-containing protein n=1 Tax=Candidatus Gottesmanbacteria bacterium RBG_13_37_7 TaxID=1798369 RepID=A0A1F5YHA1_9BACT|nr:MAG: hypothetical protein A2Y99_04350 [Candidatus Gottesmanbacteria bacterium RBG_13_37_7]